MALTTRDRHDRPNSDRLDIHQLQLNQLADHIG